MISQADAVCGTLSLFWSWSWSCWFWRVSPQIHTATRGQFRYPLAERHTLTTSRIW